jgi:hypothetical protein
LLPCVSVAIAVLTKLPPTPGGHIGARQRVARGEGVAGADRQGAPLVRVVVLACGSAEAADPLTAAAAETVHGIVILSGCVSALAADTECTMTDRIPADELERRARAALQKTRRNKLVKRTPRPLGRP